jgi:Polyketide cyclase / dehydrase and lipid transport
MASLKRELRFDNSAEQVWDAVRDFHAVARRVAPGFVNASKADGNVRIIAFANGTSAREELVDSDDSSRRLVYAIANERLTHYNAVVQVFAESKGCRLVWTVDLLPNAMAPYVIEQMDAAVQVMQPTLEEA